MTYNKFQFKIIFKVVLIVFTSLLISWVFQQEHLIVTRFAVILVLVFLVYHLIRYVSRTNRSLGYFLQCLRYVDFVNDGDFNDKSFKELNISYNEIINNVKQAYLDKESLNHYLKNTVEHVGSGLISFDETGHVEICNRTAKTLLNINHLKNITSLDDIQEGLGDFLLNIDANKPDLISLHTAEGLQKISVRATQFQLQGKPIKLLALQNIKPELDAGEIEAWQKLFRVLTHEIMNSVTPIRSLTSTIMQMLSEMDEADSCGDVLTDSLEGLRAINKRSNDLLSFVKSYKSLTRIPTPHKTEFHISDLLEQILLLLKYEIEAQNIDISVSVTPENLILNADEKQVGQILINLIKNAIYALENQENGTIEISGYEQSGQLLVKVKDTGCGIPEEELDKIFIPFYTTRENGSGVGLSLSRQMMRLHNGNLSVASVPGKETVFTLAF